MYVLMGGEAVGLKAINILKRMFLEAPLETRPSEIINTCSLEACLGTPWAPPWAEHFKQPITLVAVRPETSKNLKRSWLVVCATLALENIALGQLLIALHWPALAGIAFMPRFGKMGVDIC